LEDDQFAKAIVEAFDEMMGSHKNLDNQNQREGKK